MMNINTNYYRVINRPMRIRKPDYVKYNIDTFEGATRYRRAVVKDFKEVHVCVQANGYYRVDCYR